MKFYFTYGSEGQPYSGGWTVVEAENQRDAIGAFEAFHPLRNGLLPCCSIYPEPIFQKTKMFKNGNLGAFCRETITIQRTFER